MSIFSVLVRGRGKIKREKVTEEKYPEVYIGLPEFLIDSNVDTFSDNFLDYVKNRVARNKDIYVDMKGVIGISSRGLAYFSQAITAARQNGLKVYFINISPEAYKFFTMTRLNNLPNVYFSKNSVIKH